MATPVKKWLLRVAPWFLPVGIVAVWQLASSVGWLSTRILPSPEGVVMAFWTLSASGELWQHLAISSFFNGLVGLIRRVKRRIRHFGSKVSSQCFSYLLVQIAREIFQPFQLLQRRAHFLLTFGIVTFQANQRLNQA